jgi:hypothetical protein
MAHLLNRSASVTSNFHHTRDCWTVMYTARMRHLLRFAWLAAVLGFVTTIGVAWALAAWLPLRGTRASYVYRLAPFRDSSCRMSTIEAERPGLLRRGYDLDFPGETKVWLAGGLLLSLYDMGDNLRLQQLPSSKLPLPVIDRDVPSTWPGIQDARGWPFLCLWCTMSPTYSPPPATSTPVRTSGGITLTPSLPGGLSDLSDARALPFRPLWRGFALNTAIYSIAWLIPMAALPSLRKHLRTRRGHCPCCNYDLVGDRDAGCPECSWNRGTTDASAPQAAKVDREEVIECRPRLIVRRS